MKLRDFLLPTPTNNHTPQLLQRAALVLMFGLVLLSFAAVNLQTLLWQSSNWLVGTILPAVVVDLTNVERTQNAMTTLNRSAVLDEAARRKAEHMASLQYFSHYSPDGVSPWYWFDQVAYTYAHAGENLAIHFTDSTALVKAWMNSPTHRANIESLNYTEIGVGTARGTYDGFDTVYVVQLFGTPAALVQPVIAPPPPPLVVSQPIVPPTALIESVRTEELVEPGLAVAINGVPLIPAEAVVLADETVAGIEAVEITPLVEDSIAPVISQEVEVSEVVDKRHLTVLVSDHFATSSGLVPAMIEYSAGTTAAASTFGTIATSPNKLLQFIYLCLGSLVAILLLLSIVVGIRHQRPLQVVYGIGLLLLMSSLFYLHGLLTGGVVIAAEPAAVEMLLNPSFND